MRTEGFTVWHKWRACLSLLVIILYYCRHVKGLVEISPSPVAPVCQVGDQLQLTCNSSGIIHRWEVTVMIPQTMTTTIPPFTSIGPSGVPPRVMISGSTFTASRLSGNDSLPLVSRMTVNPVNSGLNGSVVSCFEGSSSTESFATTLIRIIDPGQFDLSVQSHSEVFSSSGVTVSLEWTLLNSQTYYQQLLRNISVEADPPLSNVMFTGNMRAQLTLSYNTLYNVSVTQHSICQQLIRTKTLLLNFSRCSDPMEVTNALAVGYKDPALEGQNIVFTCRPGQILNGSNSSTCMGNGEWDPDPGEVKCTGTQVTTTTSQQTCMPQDACSGPTTVTDTSQRNTLGIVLGVIFGIILGIILAAAIAIAMIVFIIILKKKRRNGGHLKYPLNTSVELDTLAHGDQDIQEYKDEGTLVYADIGQRPTPEKSRINTHLLDDNDRVDYALLDHSVHEHKISTSAAKTSDNSPSVNLDNLLIQLRPQVGPKWYPFGEAAGISTDALDKIAEQCPPDECIVELFDHWLRNSTEPPTWKTVADLLKAINLTQLGSDIEKVYTTGTLPIEVDMNRIPKLDSQEEEEPPPPLPARSANSYTDVPSLISQAGDSRSQGQKPRAPPPLSNEVPAPAIPPKPPRMKSTNN